MAHGSRPATFPKTFQNATRDAKDVREHSRKCKKYKKRESSQMAEKRKPNDRYNDQVKVKKTNTCLQLKKNKMSKQNFGKV